MRSAKRPSNVTGEYFAGMEYGNFFMSFEIRDDVEAHNICAPSQSAAAGLYALLPNFLRWQAIRQ
jgi:hypothetical protein